MKAKYLGDPARGGEGPRVVRLYGRVFPKGRFVTIGGDDAETVFAKLAGNNHFETGEGDGEADQTPIEPEITEAEIQGAGAFDPDGDGHVGGSTKSPEKDEVIAKLEAIQGKHPEVEFDRRWGLPKLRAALEAAEFEHGED